MVFSYINEESEGIKNRKKLTLYQTQGSVRDSTNATFLHKCRKLSNQEQKNTSNSRFRKRSNKCIFIHKSEK